MIFINLLANNVRKENKIAVGVAILHDTMIYFKCTYRLDALMTSHLLFMRKVIQTVFQTDFKQMTFLKSI
jgi:hypothetical protein